MPVPLFAVLSEEKQVKKETHIQSERSSGMVYGLKIELIFT